MTLLLSFTLEIRTGRCPTDNTVHISNLKKKVLWIQIYTLSVECLNGEFLSSILHLWPLDPDPPRSRIWIRIHSTVKQISYVSWARRSLAEQSVLAELGRVVVDSSLLTEERLKSRLDLYDCLQAFSSREELDQNNPWFCPVCRRHQTATKTLSGQPASQ